MREVEIVRQIRVMIERAICLVGFWKNGKAKDKYVRGKIL